MVRKKILSWSWYIQSFCLLIKYLTLMFMNKKYCKSMDSPCAILTAGILILILESIYFFPSVPEEKKNKLGILYCICRDAQRFPRGENVLLSLGRIAGNKGNHFSFLSLRVILEMSPLESILPCWWSIYLTRCKGHFYSPTSLHHLVQF